MPALDFSREHADPLAAAVPPLVLDRQRVIHSAAFRRLLQKTQVFVSLDDDHFRTRMTHTLEVANLARLLAQRLDLNEDLAEVVALAHDLGHPPFGHAGEKALQTCMSDFGGFEHNQHTLRVVETLEHPYPEFHGLNLTHAARECLAKHRTRYDAPGPHPLQDGLPPPPESLIVDWADRVAYGLHDLQDGLYAGLFAPELLDELTLWRDAYAGPPPGAPNAWRRWLRPTIDAIQQHLLADATERARTTTPPQARLSPQAEAALAELDAFLFERMYRHPRLVEADAKAKRVVTSLFTAYVEDPSRLPERYVRRIDAQGLQRVVADYLAGMTDRFALQEHKRLFDPRA